VISCSEYHKVVNPETGKPRFDDMPEVVKEGEDMVEGLKKLNFEIIYKKDPNSKAMFDLFKDLFKQANAAIKSNKRLFFFFYYTGHGKIKDQTYMVVNEEDFKKYMFPFERKVRNLSLYKNTNVVALFDCCREAVHAGEEVPKEKQVHLQNSKGERVDEALYQVHQAIEQANKDEELMTITFGCKPTYGVMRDSCLGPQYLKHLEKFASKNNGRVIFPMALVDFVDNNKQAETTIKCPMQAVLTWGKPDLANSEVKMTDFAGTKWMYTGPIKNRKAHGKGKAVSDG